MLVSLYICRTSDNTKLLRFCWRAGHIDMKVDLNKCNTLYLVIEYEDEAKKIGYEFGFQLSNSLVCL